MSKNVKTLIRIAVSVTLYVAARILLHFFPLEQWLEIAIYAAIYLVVAYDVLWKAVRNIAHGQVFDENFLMTLATIGAFFIEEYTDAVVVMVLYQLGEIFQSYAVGKSRKSISALMEIRPETANVVRDGVETEVHPIEIEIGEIFVVRPGERIALDGVVQSGACSLDTSAITGESAPRSVVEGDEVVSGCINLDGLLYVRSTSDYDGSTVAKILEMVENASSQKAPAENFITKFSRYYTPAVVLLALVIGIVPPIFNGEWSEWLKRAMMFLFVSCPCALVISVPLSFFGGIAAASKCGILVKGGNYLEMLSQTKTVAFDKTGTLTQGKFSVRQVIPEENREEILATAALAEQFSTHPIAMSITAACKPSDANVKVTEIAGRGIKAYHCGDEILCGNATLMTENGVEFVPAEGTVTYVAKNGKFLGAISVADQPKADAQLAIEQLKNCDCTTVMLTGDNEKTAKEIAAQLGIDEVHCQLLPADKVTEITKLKASQKGKVAFVGDGINDAPVLATADVGIAMGAMGSDAAIEAADVVLMYDNPSSVATAKKISVKTMRIVAENIIFALAVKFAVLALTATGVVDSMVLAIFADVGVSVLAILNAMRAMRVKKQK